MLREGDEGGNAYIVSQGTCEVYRSVGDRTETLRVVGPGGVVGEVGLFTGARRVANVRAITDVTALVVTPAALEQELGRASWMRAFGLASSGRGSSTPVVTRQHVADTNLEMRGHTGLRIEEVVAAREGGQRLVTFHSTSHARSARCGGSRVPRATSAGLVQRGPSEAEGQRHEPVRANAHESQGCQDVPVELFALTASERGRTPRTGKDEARATRF
jgi:hypothetical protein